MQLGGKPLVEIGAKSATGKIFKDIAEEYLKVLRARVAKGELRPNSFDHIERQGGALLLGSLEIPSAIQFRTLHAEQM